MSVRLTNEAREKIIKAAVTKSGFPARLKAAKDKRNDAKWACLVAGFGGLKKYRALTERFRTIQDKVEALHNDGIRAASPFSYSKWDVRNMNLGGMSIEYPDRTSEGEYAHLPLIRLKEENAKVTLLGDHSAVKEFLAVEKEVNDLEKTIVSLTEQIKAVVYSVNSTKRLVEVWPESAELIPSDIEVQRAALPAINFDNLNAALGIPSAKKA